MLVARRQSLAERRLLPAVRGQLSDTNVIVQIRSSGGRGGGLQARLQQSRDLARRPRVLVVFWWGPAGKGDVYLYLPDPKGGRMLVRRVASGPLNDRVEAAAIIIGSSVRALAARRPGSSPPPRTAAGPASARRPRPNVTAAAGAPRAAAPSPGASPRRSRGRSRPPGSVLRTSAHSGLLQRPPWLGLEVGYALASYNAANVPLHGVQIGLTARVANHLAVGLSYRVLEAANGRRDDLAEVTLQRNPVCASARVGWRLGRVSLGVRGGVVLDYVSVEARSPAGSGTVFLGGEDRGDWHLLAAVEAWVALRVVDRISLLLGVGMEVVLRTARYAVQQPSALKPTVILRPWPVQPGGRLGLRVDLF